MKELVVGRSGDVSRPSVKGSVWMESARVLIVDDHADTIFALELLLRHFGHDVRSATSGREALAIAREFAPELAILDIDLRDMSGCDVARQLREAAGDRPLALIALTGFANKTQCMEASFDRHVLKPVDAPTLDLHMRVAHELSRTRAA